MLRRTFLKTAAAATAATALARSDLRAAASAPTPKIALGLDNFSVRALGWKAPELITYAAALRCDTLFISDLDAYASFDPAALRAVRRQADDAGLARVLVVPPAGGDGLAVAVRDRLRRAAH